MKICPICCQKEAEVIDASAFSQYFKVDVEQTIYDDDVPRSVLCAEHQDLHSEGSITIIKVKDACRAIDGVVPASAPAIALRIDELVLDPEQQFWNEGRTGDAFVADISFVRQIIPERIDRDGVLRLTNEEDYDDPEVTRWHYDNLGEPVHSEEDPASYMLVCSHMYDFMKSFMQGRDEL